MNAEATKDCGSADDGLKEQDVEGKEEILTDQHQHPKEVGDWLPRLSAQYYF